VVPASVIPARFVAIHGHFYQPPRESPWLERIDVQDSAAPYHDWNARVTAECYAPNTAARRVDAQNRILDVVDNFAALAFDVGPTLMAWLERERPDVYAAILRADQASRAARGHGNAIAQAYGHAILPLCSRQDKATQVRWGLADFRHRFGRESAGMWLPETAVDRETLEVLVDEGVQFTLLAPGQAASVREPGGGWRPGAAALDSRRAYRCQVGHGRELALFFYDGTISHAIAFDGLLRSGDAMATRLLAGFDASSRAQLIHVATDGESYGHHHRFGEMALAAACARIQASGTATLTNHAAFLAAHPPTTEARVVDGSSWSCAHGVERWRADCGCRAGRHPGWTQRWRAPLREALDWLRGAVDPLYEARAATLVKDPWAARDAYIDVILDKSPPSVNAFFDRQQMRPLNAAERVQALRCFELQRHRLLMYTSCGWFFDEISGIETVQVLRYAARVLQLARALGGDAGLEAEFLRRLAAAPSNVADLRDGADVWRRQVVPSVTDLARVAAHYAIAGPSEGYGELANVHAFRIERLSWARMTAREASLTIGRVRVTAEPTTESEEADVAVLHAANGEIHCRVRTGLDAGAIAAARSALFRESPGRGRTAWPPTLDRCFGGASYGIADVFPDERRRLLARLAERALETPEDVDDCKETGIRQLLGELRLVEGRVPPALASVARRLASQSVNDELDRLAAGASVSPAVDRIRALIAGTRPLGISLDLQSEEVAPAIQAALGRLVRGLGPGATAKTVNDALGLLALGTVLETPLDLWEAQNAALRLWREGSQPDRDVLAPLMAALGFAPAALLKPRQRK
jgi:alpha-amylase/alpha-mannosidase (GH57 family)